VHSLVAAHPKLHSWWEKVVIAT